MIILLEAFIPVGIFLIASISFQMVLSQEMNYAEQKVRKNRADCLYLEDNKWEQDR